VNNYNISINDDGEGVATFTQDSIIMSVPSTHPSFQRVVQALVNGEDPSEFMSVKAAISEWISGRVVAQDEEILFDGEPVHGLLANTILRYKNEGRDPSGLALFMERLAENPSKRARDQLFQWVENQKLTVDVDGYFLAHKAVRATNVPDVINLIAGSSVRLINAGWFASPEERIFQSISSGTAFVNGIEFNGPIPNWVGAVVTMPRPQVDDDQARDCSTGLHVGSFAYARGFGPNILVVRVDPADVVSVPQYDTNKLRCCRYEVIEEQVNPQSNLSYLEPEASFDPDDVMDYLETFGVPAVFLRQLQDRLNDDF